jgi:hypothetical protein
MTDGCTHHFRQNHGPETRQVMGGQAAQQHSYAHVHFALDDWRGHITKRVHEFFLYGWQLSQELIFIPRKKDE